jgi:voltage-gated potassium channel
VPDSASMESSDFLPPAHTDGLLGRDIAISTVRTVVGLVFIFSVLSLVPEKTEPKLSIPIVLLGLGMVGYAWALRWQIKRVRKAKHPEIMATESIILSAGLFLAIFSAIYVMLEGENPGSFSEPVTHFTATYFALTVLATVGFGDITAVSNAARFVVMLQMALGLGFIAVIIRVFATTAKRARRVKQQAGEVSDG